MRALSFGSVRQWHWVSASVCLAGMLLFAITGITLNHAGDIKVAPTLQSREGQVPTPLINTWLSTVEQPSHLSAEIRTWLAQQHQLSIPAKLPGEWDYEEYYLAMPGPGKDAWLALDVTSGNFVYEETDRGWLAYFNDLHKGRDTGTAWRWFIDIFAVGCVVFCVTGLILLWRQSSHRQTTAPLTTLGILVPLVLMLAFIH